MKKYQTSVWLSLNLHVMIFIHISNLIFSRTGSRNLAIIITDGESNDRDETFQMAVEARKADIDIISVGVSMKSKAGRQELRALANDPDDRNMFNVENFGGLYNLTDTLVAAVCNSEFYKLFI